MLKFQIKLEDIESGKKLTTKKLQKVLWRSVNKINEIAIKNAPVDTGRLRSSINITPNNPNAYKYIISDGVDYGIYLEYGTTPHRPPVSALKDWSRRVLKDEGLAYAVAEKIKKEGTEAQPFMRPALKSVENKWLPKFIRDEFQKDD